MLMKAALNGTRERHAHPALPLGAEQLAASAAACATAGAGAIHMHPRAPDDRESLAAAVIDRAVRAVRAALGARIPVGVSTGAWIEPDPERRAALVRQWREPDMASVNLSEDGAELVMLAMRDAGIGIEAGVTSIEDAERLAATGVRDELLRVLVEIVRDPADPVAEARRVGGALDRLGVGASRVYHGHEQTTWPVLRYAVAMGYDTRIGLEDTLELPDGGPAASNEALVRVALELSQNAQG